MVYLPSIILGFPPKIDDFNFFFFVINKVKISGLVFFCMFGMEFRFPQILDHGKLSTWVLIELHM